MTKQDIINHFDYLLKATTGKKPDGAFLNSAYSLGLGDFWGAYPWAFKEKRTTVATTASQEHVVLPDEFEGMVSLIEWATDDGRKLRYMPSDEYDRLVPYSADLSTSTPAYYKIVYDYDSGLWRAYLYPTPDAAISLQLIYHVIADDGGVIPDKYSAALFAHISKFLVLAGTKEYWSAANAAEAEDLRLSRGDEPYHSKVSRFLTEGESEQPREKKWWEEG